MDQPWVHRGPACFGGPPQAANYNEAMFVVRYVALTALVISLGGAALVLANTTIGEISSDFHLIAATCGAIIFVSLFIMKFIGPPPHAFTLRAGLSFAMTGAALYGWTLQRDSAPVMAVNLALGLVLLSWYARE